MRREKQLNALDAELVERLYHQLLLWAQRSSGVRAVMLESSTPRSFCSGGDVKSARAAVLAAPYPDAPPAGHHIHRVFQAEYGVVCLSAALPIPYISICQGIWMGLGFGISGFGSARVVTDSTVFAMPENAIGLWPDVGFALAAAACPGALGLFLGLTGARVASAADLLWLGLASHYVPQERLQDLRQDLAASPSDALSVLDRYAAHPPGPGPLQACAPLLDACFQPLLSYHELQLSAAAALELLVERLVKEAERQEDGSPKQQLLQSALQSLGSHSPESLAITLSHFAAVKRDVQQGGPLAVLPELMQVEYRMAVRRVGQPDFLDGVRAALVDKDRAPKWRSSKLSSLISAGNCDGGYASLVAELPDPELGLARAREQ